MDNTEIFTTEANLESLPFVREFVLNAARKAGLSSTSELKLDLALEEAFVNVASYAYSTKNGPVEIQCACGNNLFCVTVRDWGINFDPLTKIPSPATGEIDDLPMGQLGRLLITTISSTCSYIRKDDSNELTFCMHI